MPAGKRIGIIGAGPAGLAALKTVLEAPEYANGEWADPVVLEAREDVGGVWLPAPASFPSPPSPPNTYPPTPLYDSLTTNLPHPVMAYSSFPFPASTPLFPRAHVVHEYLNAYADQIPGNSNGRKENNGRRLREYVRLQRRVVGVRWSSPGVWTVDAELSHPDSHVNADDTTIPIRENHTFDALLICTGHYSTPNYPSEREMPGLGAWIDAGRAAHAVWYRNAGSVPIPVSISIHPGHLPGGARDVDDEVTGEESEESEERKSAATVLIIGSGPSGTDISADLGRAGVVRRVIMSSSSYTPPPPTSASASATTPTTTTTSSTPAPPTNTVTGLDARSTTEVIQKPLPVRFHVATNSKEGDGPPIVTGKVTFADGTEEEDVAFVVLATGYQVDFPFFEQGSPSPSVMNTPVDMETDTRTSDNDSDQRTSEAQSSRRFRLPKGVLPTPFWDTPEDHKTTKSLTNSNICVFPLARHLFPLPGFYDGQGGQNIAGVNDRGEMAPPHPTSLAFLGLNVRVAPLPLVKAQARAVLSAFAAVHGSLGAPKEVEWDKEERDIRERWEMLSAQYEDSRGAGRKQSTDSPAPEVTAEAEEDASKRKFIAKIWHRLPDQQQFAYRDELDQFAFDLRQQTRSDNSNNHNPHPQEDQEGPHKTRQWESRMYARKDVLRTAWRALEARNDGSAEEWVRGVGSGRTGRRKKREGDEGNGEGAVMNGEEEWVDMMERLIVWWETEGKKESESGFQEPPRVGESGLEAANSPPSKGRCIVS